MSQQVTEQAEEIVKDSPAQSNGGGGTGSVPLFETVQISEQGLGAGSSNTPTTGDEGLDDKLGVKNKPTRNNKMPDEQLLDEARLPDNHRINTAILQEVLSQIQNDTSKRPRSRENSICADAPKLARRMGLLGGALDSDDDSDPESENEPAFTAEDLEAGLFDEAVGGEPEAPTFMYEANATQEDEAIDLLVGLMALVEENELARSCKVTPQHRVPSAAPFVRQLYGTAHSLTHPSQKGLAFTPNTVKIIEEMKKQVDANPSDEKVLTNLGSFAKTPEGAHIQTILTHAHGDVKNNKEFLDALKEKAKSANNGAIQKAFNTLKIPARMALACREGSRATLNIKGIRAISAVRELKEKLKTEPEQAVQLAARFKELKLASDTKAGQTMRERLSSLGLPKTAAAETQKAVDSTFNKILSSDEFKRLSGKSDAVRYQKLTELAKKDLSEQMAAIASKAVKRTKNAMIKELGPEATAADKQVIKDAKLTLKEALEMSDKALKSSLKPGQKLSLGTAAKMDINARMRTRSTMQTVAADQRTGVHLPSAVNSFLKEKTGDHSIHIKDVEAPNLGVPGLAASQTILAWARSMIHDTNDRVRWDFDRGVFILETLLHGPVGGGYNRQAVYQGEYPRLHDLDVALIQNTRIRFDELGERQDEMPLDALDDLMKGGVIDTRLGMGAVQGPVNVERVEAEKLGQMLDQFRTRYSLKTVFVIGFLILDQLVIAERMNAQVECGRPVDQAVIRINKRPEAREDPIYMQLYAALAKDRLFVDAIKCDRITLRCMMMISAGPQGIFLNGQENRVIHIAQTIISDPIFWAILTEDNAPLVPANHVTAANMLAFLHMFAAENNVHDDLVKGYQEAQLMLNNQVHNLDVNKPAVMITSTFETREIHLPKPKPHNPLWKIIGREPARPTNGLYNHDLPHIQALDARQLGVVGALYAAVMSIGFSSVFQENNLGGVDLCHVRGVHPERARAGPIVRALAYNEGGRAPIFAFACNVAGQITGTVAQNDVFGNRGWCANFVNFPADIGANELWGGAYGEQIPHQFHPFCVAFGFRCWLTHWGVSSPGVDIMLRSEVEMLGHFDGMKGWDAGMGSREYETTLLSPIPQKFVDYAHFVINNLGQHLNEELEWRIRFQVFKRFGNRVKQVANIAENAYQPQYDREMMMIVPYTMKTYSWEHEAQLVPFVPIDQMNRLVYQQIAAAEIRNSQWAGIILPRVPRSEPLPSDYAIAAGLGEAAALGGRYARTGGPRAEN